MSDDEDFYPSHLGFRYYGCFCRSGLRRLLLYMRSTNRLQNYKYAFQVFCILLYQKTRHSECFISWDIAPEYMLMPFSSSSSSIKQSSLLTSPTFGPTQFQHLLSNPGIGAMFKRDCIGRYRICRIHVLSLGTSPNGAYRDCLGSDTGSNAFGQC